MKNMDAPLYPAKMTAMLRDGVLAIGPDDIGLTAATCPPVWGTIMEWVEAGVVVSLAALLDGSVSVYLSDGSGVIGCGLHPDVRVAASKMLRVAEQVADQCEPAEHYPAPLDHQVRFYLLTNQGVLGAAAERAELDEGAEALAELYYAGHGVIGMVELLGAGVDLIDEMRMAETAAQRDACIDSARADAEQRIGAQELKSRGRGCRILPYVGSVARRSQN
jgi:hypothetical protein